VLVNVLEQSEGMKAADDGLLQRGWTTKEVGFCIQNFLCIIEMFFIAIGMHYAFHYTGVLPYLDPHTHALPLTRSKTHQSTINNILPHMNKLNIISISLSKEWASEEVAAAHKGTSPWTAFFHSKVVNTVKDVLHDVNSVKNTVKSSVKRLPNIVRYSEKGSNRRSESFSKDSSDDIDDPSNVKKGPRFRTVSMCHICHI
jgi:hypothetical protein